MCPVPTATHTNTVAGEAAWNQRPTAGPSQTGTAGDDQRWPGRGGTDGLPQGIRTWGVAGQPGGGGR
jgi:hypothetical protein